MAKTKPNKKSTAAANEGATVGYEAQLWQMADALRGSMDAAEYKHVVLGLLFLKYISDAFEEQHAKLIAEKRSGADPEDPDEYRALSIFWVPPEARGMPHRNLAVELLQKLLSGEITTRRKKNVVQARSFAEMLEQTVRRYQNRAIEAAQVIEELIQLAKQMREANARGEKLGLSEDELAFYDALETNDSAVKVLGDETLRTIARELVETVRNNVTIDWTMRENVRAQLRVLVKRILRCVCW